MRVSIDAAREERRARASEGTYLVGVAHALPDRGGLEVGVLGEDLDALGLRTMRLKRVSEAFEAGQSRRGGASGRTA